jgi:alpha-1,6-mannosyltransferase
VTRTLAAAGVAARPTPAGLSDADATGRRWGTPLAVVCGLVMLAASVEIVLDASLEHSPLIPHSPHIATWLQSLGGERLGYRVFLIALLAFSAAYGVLLALANARVRPRGLDVGDRMTPHDPPATGGAAPVTGAVRTADAGTVADRGTAGDRTAARWAIGLVAALNLIVFAGPILISTDVFSYIAYARMGVVHGVNPYLNGPVAIVGDPVFRYVGHDWLRVATAYGPLYTLITYPLGLLGVVGGLWGMKLYALIASVITLMLTWRIARRRGHDRVFALLAVGANPLYVIYGLGGAHNDLIMLALMMGAVALTVAVPRADTVAAGVGARDVRSGDDSVGGGRTQDGVAGARREAAAGALVIAGALVKATVAVLLPFMVLSRRRPAPVLGALAALVLGALAGYAAFGIHGIDVVSALNRDSAFVSTDSFPNELAHLFGKPGVFPVDHDLLKAALVLIVAHLLWRTWRGYDWVAASGWALLAISVTSTWLLAWYILWPLPLAVLTRDRRLLTATLFVQGLFIVHQTAPLWAPVS